MNKTVSILGAAWFKNYIINDQTEESKKKNQSSGRNCNTEKWFMNYSSCTLINMISMKFSAAENTHNLYTYTLLKTEISKSILLKNRQATCFQSHLMAEVQQAVELDLSQMMANCITDHIYNSINGLSQANACAINAKVDHALKEKEEKARKRQNAEAVLAAKNRELEVVQVHLAMMESTATSDL
ncbi:hypothetical protein BDY19DRAFT_907127 [Irpex rosettiformis]|uniref:Uncharacterized protein n=1 Tax=Irpex rosettiformis TaxID=378272 RepID=A0ACB8U0D8_9APHY|nr:hypothetical protein BDY19DRAFT_907127 [Irpex rosettiformis]